jgi:hypothetical protein
MKKVLLIILLLFSFGSGACLAQGTIYLMVSEKSPWNDVSSTEVRSLFIGKTKSLQRTPGRPILLTKEPDYSSFIKMIARNTPSRFERNWKKLLFSGKATLPARVDSLEEALRLLNTDSNAVCFSSTKIEAKGVKFLAIR